eukprot:2611918-Amphidinium_carterae.2
MSASASHLLTRTKRLERVIALVPHFPHTGCMELRRLSNTHVKLVVLVTTNGSGRLTHPTVYLLSAPMLAPVSQLVRIKSLHSQPTAGETCCRSVASPEEAREAGAFASVFVSSVSTCL